jgi:predicted anti-sigma-YlaC factor YlaD
MPSNGESKCYFIQLQIDGYLDGDLSEAQQGVFMSHAQDCSACASEYRYAQTVQDAVMELPQIECGNLVLEPIHSLTAGGRQAKEDAQRGSLATQIAGLLNSVPLYFRYGMSAALVAVVAVAVSFSVVTPIEEPGQLVASESVEQYSPEDITLALQELNVAIDYLNQVSQRTEVMIGDRFLVTPLQDSINASFQRARIRENNPLNNGPI